MYCDYIKKSKRDAQIIATSLLNNNLPFYLSPNLDWTSSPVAVVTRFPLGNVIAPDFYNLPTKTLPTGNYTFEIKLTESAPNPAALTASIATGTNTIVFNDISVVQFQPDPVFAGFKAGVQGQIDFSGIAS